MSKGGYRGGSTIVRPGSGWFTYPADKPVKAKKRHAPTTAQRPSLAAHAAQARREALAARAEAVKARQAAAALERIARDKEERAERLAAALRANGRPASPSGTKPRPVAKAASRVSVKAQFRAGKSAGHSAPAPRPVPPRSYKKPTRKKPLPLPKATQ